MKKMPKFLKVIYFDESIAQDYIDIVNGGRLEWSKEENKEKLQKYWHRLKQKRKLVLI